VWSDCGFDCLQEPELSDSSNAPPLPTPTLENLEELARRLAQPSPMHKDHIANCVKDAWLNKLFELFHTAEDLEKPDALHAIFNVVKGLFLLNDVLVYEKILADSVMMECIAALEYDPELPSDVSRKRHRQFLKQYARRALA
jgi:protein phosphatase-4 regulatory subunit 3